MSAAGTPQCCRLAAPFVGRREVVIARLVDPQAVRLEIGRDGQLRRGDLALAAAARR